MVELIKKYKETIMYLIFGVLTTVVNIVTYTICTRVFDINYMISNIIAWIIAVLFAYVTNKFYVFESKDTDFKYVLKELSSFVSCRLFSLGIEMVMMFVLINMMSFNDFIVKIITNVVVIILNYVFSKILIFKK